MIRTKKELNTYLQAEQKFYDTCLKAKLLGYLSYYKGCFLRCLRYAEYYHNKENRNFIDKLWGGIIHTEAESWD